MNPSDRIRILSEETVNKVAAGEVVERPAAALKELVENSLDAGAGQIDVALENAGKTLILVRDDGEGMSHDEVLLALERHSTSKIREVEDLARISTFGFRGEALPSLAAVSRLQIRTRKRKSPEGTRVTVSAGRITKVLPCGTAPGTEVEVRALFRNIPARLKFLKTNATELSHCVSAVTRLALAHPATAFTLSHGGRTLLHLPSAASIDARLRDHLGSAFFNNLLPFSAEEEHVSLKGFVARPGSGRPGTDNQQVFVNGRPVRDHYLARMVKEAGGDFFRENKGAVSYFIWIDVPPDHVDVNVHPTKREVRFHDVGGLRSFLRRSLQDCLKEDRLRFFRPASLPPQESSVEEKKLSYTPQGKPATQLPLSPSAAPLSGDTTAPLSPSSSGQLFASYLVCLGPEGLVLVDQHAAHERITYERTLDLLKTEGTQRLLQPFHFDLDAAETELLDTLLPDLEELGIEIGRTGDRDFRITAMPFTISRQGAVACIRDLLDKVRRGEAAPKVPDFRKHLASSVACHSSVRAHRKLAPEEASALLQDLFQAEDPAHCPHGRPTFITIGRDEIEKRFGRK